VTLAARSNKRREAHPTSHHSWSDRGQDPRGFTIAGSRIGAWLVSSGTCRKNSVVVGVPGRVTFRDGARVPAST